MAYKNPRAFSRNEVMEQDAHFNKEQRRLNEIYQHRMRESFGGGVDPRRRRELADAGMVQEDPRAMANLPTQAIHAEFPSDPFYATGPYNPSFSLDVYEV